MTREHVLTLFGPRGKPGRYLAGILVNYLERRENLVLMGTGDRNSWPVWDEGTVAHLLGLTKSEVHPRPGLRDDLKFDQPPAGRPPGSTFRWVTWIDSEKLWEDFGRKLDWALREEGTK